MTTRIAIATITLAALAALGAGCAWNTPLVIAYRSSVSVGGQGTNGVSSHTEMTGGGTASVIPRAEAEKASAK